MISYEIYGNYIQVGIRDSIWKLYIQVGTVPVVLQGVGCLASQVGFRRATISATDFDS